MPVPKVLKKGDKIGKAWVWLGTKVYLAVNDAGLPMALDIAPANIGEVMACRKVVRALPKGAWLSGDKAYDTPGFRLWLKSLGLRPSIPYKCKRWNDKGTLRFLPGQAPDNPLIYKQRYKVERAFAWFTKFKRLNIRYERLAHLYKAFWHLGALLILFDNLTG